MTSQDTSAGCSWEFCKSGQLQLTHTQIHTHTHTQYSEQYCSPPIGQNRYCRVKSLSSQWLWEQWLRPLTFSAWARSQHSALHMSGPSFTVWLDWIYTRKRELSSYHHMTLQVGSFPCWLNMETQIDLCYVGLNICFVVFFLLSIQPLWKKTSLSCWLTAEFCKKWLGGCHLLLNLVRSVTLFYKVHKQICVSRTL